MRIVLPPSETKQLGGETGSTLDWASLAHAELTSVREGIAADLIAVSSDDASGLKALGLGAKGAEWLESNQQLESSPVMPAICRYTGVVFDALDYSTLEEAGIRSAHESLWLFSALFGPVRATDMIPRYRLSFDSKLPGEPLKKRWQPYAEAMWRGDFVVDLRSEGYRALSPLPGGCGVYVRVVENLSGGVAAGHANKTTKGRLVRSIVASGERFTNGVDLLAWAAGHGFEMAPGAEGELLLAVVD